MIEKSVILPLEVADAFDLFTEKISLWWPAERRHTQDSGSQIFLLASGRFYERSGDGRETELGHVRSWIRPRLILLDFFVATGPERPTEVEIVFSPHRDGAKVNVTHRPKPSSEAIWSERAPVYTRAWEDVLASLVSAAI